MIDDRAMYPGSYVKELLRNAGAGEILRWVELGTAAEILDRRPDTLRKQCARWAEMMDPPVRVRKKGPADQSHWLLCEQDLFGLVRRKGVPAPGGGEGPVDDSEEALIDHWCEEATRNL